MRRADRLEEHRDNADRAELRELDMSTGANAAQQEYWNGVAGPRWVGLAGYVEKRVERINDLLLVRSAVAPGEKVLEVGCGTGAATVPLAEAVGDTGEVVGIDISEPMLAAARKRISQSAQRNITLLQADAQVHAFEPNRFDLIASRFGVMFFANPVAAFRNLFGAARPGGRLCFACWAALEENRHWLIPYEVALRHLGPPAPKPPHAPGPMAFADPEYVRSVLEGAGYRGVEIRRETPEIIGASPEEEAEHACIMGPSGRLIEEKKPQERVRELIKQEMTEAFAAHAKGGEMVLSSTIFLVRARRAGAQRTSEVPR
jgi:SAM-dependent methyltransferase